MNREGEDDGHAYDQSRWDARELPGRKTEKALNAPLRSVAVPGHSNVRLHTAIGNCPKRWVILKPLRPGIPTKVRDRRARSVAKEYHPVTYRHLG